MLRFWSWHETYNAYDFCALYIHTDTSTDLIYQYYGYGRNWYVREFDLSAYAGQTVTIEFRFTSDSATTGDGFFFDDVEVYSTAP
jgi:bacillopeptidase F (M6 metalloprotease family)